MRLAFFGSRTLTGGVVSDIIGQECQKHRPQYIVTSGGIDGVCHEVEVFCKHQAVPIKLYYPDRVRHGPGMYNERSKAIINDSDFVVLIHDGQSKGTANELTLVKKLGKPFEYYRIASMQPELTDRRDEELPTGAIAMLGDGRNGKIL